MTERNPYHLPAGSSKGGEFTTGQLNKIGNAARESAGLSAKKWTGVQGFHGTTLDRAKKIYKEGISKSKNRDAFGREPSVFFTSDEEKLSEAEDLVYIRFRIPQEVSNKVFFDTADYKTYAATSNWRITADIDPSWITGFFIDDKFYSNEDFYNKFVRENERS